jgi:hypothetical protein
MDATKPSVTVVKTRCRVDRTGGLDQKAGARAPTRSLHLHSTTEPGVRAFGCRCRQVTNSHRSTALPIGGSSRRWSPPSESVWSQRVAKVEVITEHQGLSFCTGDFPLVRAVPKHGSHPLNSEESICSMG